MPAAPPAAPVPPFLRDPWSWLAALAVLPIVLHGLGAPLGEPVAEDFDFLRHNLLLGRHGLLDGGGSLAFWRPVSHQLYYTVLGSLILDHPRVVAALHAVLLALSAVLLGRALRWRGWSGSRALAAAAFPFFMESARTVFSWPSHGVELTSLLFTALALHEAARRRLATCLVALVLALLSKEVAVVAAALIPLLPAGRGAAAPIHRRERLRWALAIGATTGAWALAYLWVRHHAGLALPHQLESDPTVLRVPLASRFSWATGNSLRAVMSMPFVNVSPEVARGLVVSAAAILVAGVSGALVNRKMRAQARVAVPWIAWGLAWFVLSSATLTTIFPFWAPNRALFGSVGLGIAVVALLGASWNLLPWAFLAVRLLAFAASPGPVAAVDIDQSPTGAFMDFQQLTRLQRLMADTRVALEARFPTLPHGALIGQHNMPRRAEYAFGGDHALQCWYRDTTLRWVRYADYSRDSAVALTTIAEYQLDHRPEVALVEPAAMRAMFDGIGRMTERRFDLALDALRLAEARQRDPDARVFLATVTGKEALCLLGLGRVDSALVAGRRTIALSRENPDGRYVTALILADRGDLASAEAQVDTLLALVPGDQDALALRDMIRAAAPR